MTVSESAFGTNGSWPTASFTFNGTGVDIISQTDVKAGIILVDVKQGTKAIKQYIVNNYYGYTYNSEADTWTVSENNGNGINSIYQVPVIAVRDLDYGTYSVTITVAYDGLFDVASKGSFDFYLDAIRVYNPLGTENSVYAKDGEASPTFKSIHDMVTEFGKEGTLVDGLKEANFNQFKTIGPNNEVYLAPGQSVTIDLNSRCDSAQIGARLIDGTSASLSVSSTSAVTVNSTVEQYYKLNGGLQGKVTITNTSGGTVALTTLKLFGLAF